MDIVKNDLRIQNVHTDDFILRLRGSQKDFGWELRDMCLALTMWCRSRADDEFDAPLLLVPRDAQSSVIQNRAAESAPIDIMDTLPSIKVESSTNMEIHASQVVKDDSVASSPYEHHTWTTTGSLSDGQAQLKRGAAQMYSNHDEPPAVDPRLAKRARREATVARW